MPHTPPWQVWGRRPWKGHHLALFLESLGLSSEATPTRTSILDLGALCSPSPRQLPQLGALAFPRLQILAAALILGWGWAQALPLAAVTPV